MATFHFLRYNSSRGGDDDDEGAEVFDRSFVVFTAMCGVALPGAPWKADMFVSPKTTHRAMFVQAGRKTKYWAVAVHLGFFHVSAISLLIKHFLASKKLYKNHSSLAVSNMFIFPAAFEPFG